MSDDQVEAWKRQVQVTVSTTLNVFDLTNMVIGSAKLLSDHFEAYPDDPTMWVPHLTELHARVSRLRSVEGAAEEQLRK